MATIDVSEKVKNSLDDVKDAEQARSYDAAIRILIHEYED
jgi:hypothetical protein